MIERLTDWRGNEYGVGDLIVYATSGGSSGAFITEAEVLAIEEYPDWREIMHLRLLVQPIRDADKWNYDDKKGVAKATSEKNRRSVRLTKLGNVTKVER